MWFFTADEHYYHSKIIEYCNRPFKDVTEMNQQLIENFNCMVQKSDITIHAGDFSWGSKCWTQEIIKQLNGTHIFLRGCHDSWMPASTKFIYQRRFEELNNQLLVVCHYCMRTWKASHYNSYHAFGHSHGRLAAVGKSHDIGVDNNNYFPVSIYTLGAILDQQPDNFNKVK